MTPSALHLFSPDWLKPLDLRTQIDRLPPVDAPCGGAYQPCRAPLCPCFKQPEEDDE